MAASEMEREKKAATARGITRWLAQMAGGLVFSGLLLFVTAGRLDWRGGWAFFGMNLLTQALSALVLIPRRPEMLADRSQARAGTKSWDRILAPAVTLLGTFPVMILAGLDARFGWTARIPTLPWLLALLAAFACQMFVLWAMASNPFFSTTVRIQSERDHRVASAGPYRLVRHPGYAGSFFYNLLVPVVLNSYWTYIFIIPTVILLVIRTALEDRTLQNELPGYRQFAGEVRSRLFPGLW